MSQNPLSEQARSDFDKARIKEVFNKILNLLNRDRHELLSLQDVRKILKPKKQMYKGMKTVPIALIAGSEGRYRDFNRNFLPKHQHLRSRWERVDRAHLQNVILPSIRLYEIGGIYFVRDGNHRVSVARMQGVEFIDAEVIKLDSQIAISPEMTKEDLKNAVIEFEKKQFFKATRLDKFRPECSMDFTATGRYDDIIQHIYGHKYYINQDIDEEISFEEGMLSWYDDIYLPIVTEIREANILSRFTGRTESDLYVWIVRHWDELKKKYGQGYPIKHAVKDFNEKYGRSIWQRIKDAFKKILRKKRH
jgi:hypothetical protein